MKLLVHICCAICWAKTLAALREEFGESVAVTGLWYNPNIHPLLEYRRRLKALRVFMERDDTPVEIIDEYGLTAFCEAVHPAYESPARCRVCYQMRLGKTAEVAARQGATHITTTMITSTHQDHDLIRERGEAAAEGHGLAFYYNDCRDADVPEALLKGIYHQQYCGCVFSEEDRFCSTTKHLYRGGASDTFDKGGAKQ